MHTSDRVSSPVTKLVIASGNAGKVREFSHLLAALDLEIRPQPPGLEVEETGSTFAENARLKATAVAKATGHWALADDSGLCVDALGGAPGVHSARYAESDRARISRLLVELAAANGCTDPEPGQGNRRAQFVAALAVADPSGAIQLEVEGHCPGEILTGPRGEGGFGYDPVFVPQGGALTISQLDELAKNQASHRGQALQSLLARWPGSLR